MVLIDRAWIEPSSKRAWQAFLTRRCCSIRERPSNWGAVDGGAEVVGGAGLVDDLDARSGQGGLDQQADLGDGDRHQTPAPDLAAATISSIETNFTRGRPWGSPAATSAASIAFQPS